MPGQKILVVDDDPNLLRLVELILRRAQYDVLVASTGETGIEYARTQKPDLILMDVMLPGIDGFVATQQIRRIPDCARIPIVFLSATDATEAKIRGLRGGGNDYITKPVKTGELLARIEAHLRPSSVALGQAITVFGCKPGVGATTLAVNLALGLHFGANKKTFLLDWQRPTGDVAFALGIAEVRSLDFILGQAQPIDEHTLKNLSIEFAPGLWVVPGPTHSGMVGAMTRKALNGVLKTALENIDYAVIDAGSFFHWEEPPLASRGDGLNVCVVTPEPLALRRAAHVAQAASERDCTLWFVLNQPWGGHPVVDSIEARLGTTLHARLPNARTDHDDLFNPMPPYYQRDAQAPFTHAIDQLADRIVKVSA